MVQSRRAVIDLRTLEQSGFLFQAVAADAHGYFYLCTGPIISEIDNSARLQCWSGVASLGDHYFSRSMIQSERQKSKVQMHR